jgi:phosphate acetyltransferase
MGKIKIAFPEYKNPIIAQAIAAMSDKVEPISADSLEEAARKVASGEASAMIAGIDYSSRDVIIAVRDHIGASGSVFSASFLMDFPDGRKYLLADCAACKNPTAAQLFHIVSQTVATARKVLEEEPKVALLSFSTLGSGGKDPSIDKIREVLARVREESPELVIDGELQLDAAVNPAIARKKSPNSPVAGQANILICPDLNSGNILYKALEQFAGARAYGPILQSFNRPASDLSRGSTVEDVIGVIDVICKLASN